MVGLRASQLPPETLRPGDVLEYYSQEFVCGDRRGHRVGIVLKISGARSDPYPVALDTQETLSLTNMVRRRFDVARTALLIDNVRWRKLRSFNLVPGVYKALTRATRLCQALKAHLDETNASIGAIVNAEGEKSSRHQHLFVREAANNDTAPRQSKPSSVTVVSPELSPISPIGAGALDADVQPEGLVENTLERPVHTVVDLTADGTDQEIEVDGTEGAEAAEGYVCGEYGSLASHNKLRRMEFVSESEVSESDGDLEAANERKEVSDTDVLAAGEFVEAVPTRWQRQKRRHQRKVKAGHWAERRSRKRRHLRLCGMTRSGMDIYHAHSMKAKKVKAILRIRGLRARLRELRLRRPTYQEPDTTGYFLLREVAWPNSVQNASELLNPEGVEFMDVGDFGRCSCAGDCYFDTCSNADAAVYCTHDSCNLDGKCSNAPRTLTTLQLFDTGRVGVGVCTSTDLNVGDIIGEYTGVLSAYDPIDAAGSGQRMKHNTGYTMLLNTKSRRNKYVYVEALNCGSMMRFISHSCTPNAAFVEAQNRSSVKVMVRMIENVYAGAQITVDYGKQTWFKCACDQCWTSPEGSEATSN